MTKKKTRAVPAILPREPLTKKARAAIEQYALVRCGEARIASFLVRYALEAERMRRKALYEWLETQMSYEEAIRYLCGDPALQDNNARREQARDVITDAVWERAIEEGGGKGDLRDWIAERDWSPVELDRLEIHSAAALAVEWDEEKQAARDLWAGDD